MAEKQTSKDRMREIVDSIENGRLWFGNQAVRER